MGVGRVVLSGNAYDDLVHRPATLTDAERPAYECDVAFIGRWEPERERLLAELSRLGYVVRVWGYHWSRATDRGVSAMYGGPAEGPVYARAIAGARITLCLLSTTAHDTVTQRSVEIPACGGFMLAERTPEHEALFADREEAAYFSTRQEMHELIAYYLAHEEERSGIARRGRQRCEASGYSYAHRLREILACL